MMVNRGIRQGHALKGIEQMQNLLGARSESKSHQSGGSTFVYTNFCNITFQFGALLCKLKKHVAASSIDQRVLDGFQDFVELQVVVPERKRTQCVLPLPFRDVFKPEYQTLF